MFKKLLIVALAVTFLFSLCSTALAIKDPNAVKTIYQGLPPGTARTQFPPVDIRPDRPDWTNAAPTLGTVTGTLQKPAMQCPANSGYCSVSYFVGPPSYGQGVQYNSGADLCDVQFGYFAIYLAGSAFTTQSGITGYVWGDDGFGFPGPVLESVPVPHASVIGFPNTTNVPFTTMIPPGTDYYLGYWPTDPTETYAALMDDGSCGTARSFYYDIGFGGLVWFSMFNAFGVDFNWVQDAEICCAPPPDQDCFNEVYYGSPAFFWTFGGGFIAAAVRQDAKPGYLDCYVDSVDVMVYLAGATAPNLGGINVNVWGDDGSGLPGVVLTTTHVPHASVQAFPTQTRAITGGINIPAGFAFHYGYANAIAGDVYPPVSDDGGLGATPPGPGVMQSSVLFGANPWLLMVVVDAPYDDNWLFDAHYCCDKEPFAACINLNYAGSPFYAWPEPDAYGDIWRNMRFSNPDICTLKTINLAFSSGNSVGNPGAEVFIWNTDGVYPTTVVTSYIVNPVVDYFPAFTSVDVSAADIVFAGDYHVGYGTIINNPGDVLALISDDGSSGTGRSIEYWNGAWWLMANSWGIDVNFLINVDVCCVPPGFCPMYCDPDDQWPIFAHDFNRTNQSGLTLGDLCGIVSAWTYTGTTALNFASPVISDDLVFIAQDDRLVAVDLLTGAVVWDTKVTPGLIPQYSLVINTALRSQLTIVDGYLYAGTGSLRGMVKADAATGNVIWARGVGVGSPLPGVVGLTRFAGPIVANGEVYFGDENGQIYALDDLTGANLYFAQLYVDAGNTVKGPVSGAPSTDGSQLFFTSYANLLNPTTQRGAVHGVQPGGAFAINWKWIAPFGGVLNEGVSSGSSFRCDRLFIQPLYAFGNFSNYSGYRQNLDPATGLEIWPDFFLQGQALFSTPATTGELVYFPQANNGFSGNALSRGVRAVTFNNSTAWNNFATNTAVDPFANNVFSDATVTCDPYVVYSTVSLLSGVGDWRIVDGNTGATLVYYAFSSLGIPHATAMAKGSDGFEYLVVSRGGFGSFAKLFAFKNGDDRPRLFVPELFVQFPGTNTSEASPVQRTDNDALVNTGCLTLTYAATLEAGSPPTARFTNVHPDLYNKSQSLAWELVDHRITDLLPTPATLASAKMANVTFEFNENGEIAMVSQANPIKPAASRSSSALAPPSWVTWIYPTPIGATVTGSIPPGGSEFFTFEFDRSGMNFLAPNYYYVEVNSNDPDYNLENPLATPQAVIEYSIPYEYCAVDTGRMAFGIDGSEWYTNYGALGDGSVAFEFTLTGSDDHMYQGTMYFMTSMDDAAWNTFGGANIPYLYPFYVGDFVDQDCGGCDFGTPLPVEYTTDGGNTYSNPIGDLCEFAMIDSLQGLLSVNQAGPSIGLKIEYREVGTYGADFADFKLIVVDVYNRNANPITGLYYGSFADWDIGSDQGFGDPLKGYVYQIAGSDINGYIGLPLSGSYWPDGSKTDPMYNAHIIENSLVIYPSAPCPDCLLDSLFAFVDQVPEDAFVMMPDGTGPDKSMLATFGKRDLVPTGSFSYGFAVYGFLGTGNPNADTEALSKFVNKYAGFARGDVNDDDLIDLRDLVRLSRYVAGLGPGPEPFKHLGDVNNDGVVDALDCEYLAAYYFSGGPPPKNEFVF